VSGWISNGKSVDMYFMLCAPNDQPDADAITGNRAGLMTTNVVLFLSQFLFSIEALSSMHPTKSCSEQFTWLPFTTLELPPGK